MKTNFIIAVLFLLVGSCTNKKSEEKANTSSEDSLINSQISKESSTTMEVDLTKRDFSLELAKIYLVEYNNQSSSPKKLSEVYDFSNPMIREGKTNYCSEEIDFVLVCFNSINKKGCDYVFIEKSEGFHSRVLGIGGTIETFEELYKNATEANGNDDAKDFWHCSAMDE